MQQLSIAGAWLLEQTATHRDERGSFHEWFQSPGFAAALGHQFPLLAQANCSVSARGALRGVHFADLPPSQAKYVTCLHGAVLDVVVDVRAGSPTFGRWEAVQLGEDGYRALYLAEGLGHAFMALTDATVVAYLCSATYDPAREHAVCPLDPGLGIDWPAGITPVMSAKDAAAPTLEQARTAGILPDYRACVAYAAGHAAGEPRDTPAG